jgi:hypothetical protein
MPLKRIVVEVAVEATCGCDGSGLRVNTGGLGHFGT